MCVVCFFALTVTLLLMILSRNVPFINFDVMWTDEIGRYLLVYLVFLGSGLAMIDGKHIRVDFLLDKMSPKVRKTVELFNDLITIAFCAIMVGGGYILVKGTMTQAVATLRKYFYMPMAWWNSAVMVGGAIMLVAVCVNIYNLFHGLWSGISDGTVDYISSDHAPHSDYEKKDSLAASASGMVGLETMLPLLLDASSKGKLTLADIQRLCCENPAKIYGLSDRKGSIRIGGDADLTLVDMKEQWTVDRNDCYTRGAKTPFTGWRLQGRPYVTICSGKKVMEAGKVIGSNGE